MFALDKTIAGDAHIAPIYLLLSLLNSFKVSINNLSSARLYAPGKPPGNTIISYSLIDSSITLSANTSMLCELFISLPLTLTISHLIFALLITSTTVRASISSVPSAIITATFFIIFPSFLFINISYLLKF